MKSVFTFFKKSKLVFLTLFATFMLIILCSMLSLSNVGNFSQHISHLQSNLLTHKYTLILSHIVVFSAIFFIGFWGFKQSAIKKEVPKKQIKAFAWLMVAFLVTVLVIDMLTFV